MDSPNITSSASLRTRLDINRAFGSLDFHGWVYNHYAFSPAMDVLDVGSGNGAQAIEALRRIGPDGSVTALDLSAESIAQLLASSGAPSNLEAEIGDMDELAALISKFHVKRYDLAHSTYALFYARDPIRVLDAMRAALTPGGRLIATNPAGPNGLRQLVNRLGFATPELDRLDRFGAEVLEPYFRARFERVDIHIGRNVLRIPNGDAVAAFYRSTAYHFAAAEEALLRIVQADIAARGYFEFEKNASMIIGQNNAGMR